MVQLYRIPSRHVSGPSCSSDGNLTPSSEESTPFLMDWIIKKFFLILSENLLPNSSSQVKPWVVCKSIAFKSSLACFPNVWICLGARWRNEFLSAKFYFGKFSSYVIIKHKEMLYNGSGVCSVIMLISTIYNYA